VQTPPVGVVVIAPFAMRQTAARGSMSPADVPSEALIGLPLISVGSMVILPDCILFAPPSTKLVAVTTVFCA
jgi:hypothetical protein